MVKSGEGPGEGWIEGMRNVENDGAGRRLEGEGWRKHEEWRRMDKDGEGWTSVENGTEKMMVKKDGDRRIRAETDG